ncbi:MAG: divergent polysaccharide deacetylase family protein, partial [Rhodospirillales bacterium]|nr:divergent polysaccharide deacetylase family protein [Rhodospirillales bacterium]
MIAIVIDDMGPNQKNARRAMTMPSPITLSFLPYADDLTPMVTRARANGHEVLLHLPMEPNNSHLHQPSPNSLLTTLDAAEISERLAWNLGRFSGYVGINNHMGSRFTADPRALAPVMAELKSRGLLFLDSRTTNQTVGRRLALQAGV